MVLMTGCLCNDDTYRFGCSCVQYISMRLCLYYCFVPSVPACMSGQYLIPGTHLYLANHQLSPKHK